MNHESVDLPIIKRKGARPGEAGKGSGIFQPVEIDWLLALEKGNYYFAKRTFARIAGSADKFQWEEFQSQLAKVFRNSGYNHKSPINTELQHTLYEVLERCVNYRKLVQGFIDNYYYELGPRLSTVLSTYFITRLVEDYRIDYEGDIRRLIYLLQPEKPLYNAQAEEFDRELSASEEYKKATDEFSRKYPGCSVQKYRRMGVYAPGNGKEFWAISGMNDSDLRYQNARKAAEPIIDLAERLEKIDSRIKKEKEKIDQWLAIATPKDNYDDTPAWMKKINEQVYLKDLEQIGALGLIESENKPAKQKPKKPSPSAARRKNIKGSPDVSFCEELVYLLRENNLLYEASSFCDTWADIFQAVILPQKIKAMVTRSRADFLKLAYRKSLQAFGEKTPETYEVEGPVYLLLQNNIESCDVDFLIVGPTVEQITLKPYGQTSLEIEPGLYTVVCEPKKSDITPLILEGHCVPGKEYPIGITLVQRDQYASPPPVSEMGSGSSIDRGLYGAIDNIDPKEVLELRFEGRAYQIKKYLGEGSGGIVYQAIDTQSRRASAFKFMTDDLLGEGSQIEFGKKEWETYSSMAAKQNVSGILSYSENLAFYQQGQEKRKKKKVAAYQMEYAEHGSLRSYIERDQQQLPLKKIISTIQQICIGVESIHASGLLHRDIRPENILVFEASPNYRVCDFTLTRSKKELMEAQLAQVFGGAVQRAYDPFMERRTVSTLQSFRQSVCSSTFYSAPEEHAGNSSGDVRSDVYSIGCILFWLLTGLEPFEIELQEKYHSLYERYKMAMDQQVLRLDFQRKKALFGDLAQLNGQLRNAGLALKRSCSLEVDSAELEHFKAKGAVIDGLRNILQKTVHPEPGLRFQSAAELRRAIEEVERGS